MRSVSRMFLMPSSSSVTLMSVPDSLRSCMPVTSASMASTGFSLHFAANSSALMPETRAYSSTISELLATAVEIFATIRVMAEPPASALMPSDAMAPAMPSTSALEKLAAVPTPARRRAMFEMLLSVAARWFPRSTMVEP